MRILQLAPSGVLGRLQNVTLLAGSLPQEEASKNDKGVAVSLRATISQALKLE